MTTKTVDFITDRYNSKLASNLLNFANDNVELSKIFSYSWGLSLPKYGVSTCIDSLKAPQLVKNIAGLADEVLYNAASRGHLERVAKVLKKDVPFVAENIDTYVKDLMPLNLFRRQHLIQETQQKRITLSHRREFAQKHPVLAKLLPFLPFKY